MAKTRQSVRFWSPTEIDMTKECLFRWYLRYVEKIRTTSTGAQVKGTYGHILAKDFHEKLGIKYDSPESFADYAGRGWWGYLNGINRQIAKEKRLPVDWQDEEEQAKRFFEIRRFAFPMFDALMERSEPVSRELELDVELRGMGFEGTHIGLEGKIDAIRVENGKIIIVDYKTGKPLKPIKIHQGTQATLYTLVTLLSAHGNPEFAELLGTTREEIEHLFTNPDALKERVGFEFLMLEKEIWETDPVTKERTCIVEAKSEPTFRTDEHFRDLIRTITGIQRSIRNETIYPELGKLACEGCAWAEPCIERAMQVGFPSKEQRRLSFDEVPYRIHTLRFRPRKRSRRRKSVSVTSTRLLSYEYRLAEQRREREKGKLL